MFNNAFIIDVKCEYGHYGYDHPLYDSLKKKSCNSCPCYNYNPKINMV